MPTTAEITQFLNNHLKSEINDLSEVKGGEWSKAYIYSDKGKDYVIRFNTSQEDFLRDKLASSYASDKLPCAKIIEVGEALGGYFAISEKVEGKFIDDLDAEEMQQIVPEVFDLFNALRNVDLSGTTGYGHWNAKGMGKYNSWREFLLDANNDRADRPIHGWRKNLAESKFGTGTFDEIYTHLQSVVDKCPEERHLIHSDLLHFNVFVKDNKISGVIDWGSSIYGDFVYDIAWFAFWSFYYPSMNGIDWYEEALKHFAKIGLNVPNFKERMQCYFIHIALDSLAYSSFKERWEFVETVTKYVERLMKS